MAGFDVSVRPLTRDDLPLVACWLGRPHVAAWWHDPSDLASVEAQYLPCITGEDPTEVFVIQFPGQPGEPRPAGAAPAGPRPIGLIQRYLVSDDPGWAGAMAAVGLRVDRTAGIDYLIGDPTLVGRGIGSAAIGLFTDLAFLRYPRADAVCAAVQQANPASWRALERAGFVRLWAGQLDSDHPSDAGPAYVYVKTAGSP